MLLDKSVVLQMWVSFTDSIDFLTLPGREILVRIKAPAALKQALATEDFMNSGNTAAKIVGGIKKRCVGIGQLLR